MAVEHVPMAPKIVIPDRQKTHGKFVDYAWISQSIKEVIKSSPNYVLMTASQKEGLDMICGKIARICTGDSNEPDHWVDISGYSQRVVESFSFEGRKKE